MSDEIIDKLLLHNLIQYELVHFNLDEFYSFQHYKAESVKNGHTLSVNNHQNDKNKSITAHSKTDIDAMVYYVYTYQSTKTQCYIFQPLFFFYVRQAAEPSVRFIHSAYPSAAVFSSQ